MPPEHVLRLNPDEWREHGSAIVGAVEEVASATSGAHLDEPIAGLLVNTAKAAWDGFAQSHQNTHHALLGHTTKRGHALIGVANEVQNQDEDAANDIQAVMNW